MSFAFFRNFYIASMDPNNAIRPDYTLPEYQEERQQLLDEGLTEQQATRSLTALWIFNNNAEKARWTAKQEHLEEARQRAEEDEAQRLQDLKDEEEATRLEDRKKNKNKYAPIKRGKVPSDPTILPAQYVTRRLKAGDYCELHYFTNKGLDEAKISALIAEPDALVMSQRWMESILGCRPQRSKTPKRPPSPRTKILPGKSLTKRPRA